MKNYITILIAVCFSFLTVNAQDAKRQTVYSLVKQTQTVEWYKTQAGLWQKFVDENPKDANGWLNLYTVKRMLKIYREGVSPEDMDAMVEQIEKAIPNTFERYYIATWNSGFRDMDDYVKNLNKAQELGPNRHELLDDLVTYYEINRDKYNLKNACRKWYESNDISSGLYAWCYNMLQSTDENAVLFTFGDNDTYPAWVLQQALGIREDVTVLNVSLMTLDKYRIAYFKELGLPEFNKSWGDFEDHKEYKNALINHIKKNTQRPVYFAISGHKQHYETFENEVHNVGLAHKWSKDKFDNIAVIKKNYENKYLLDYLKIDLSNDISQGVVNNSSSNYMLPFMTLYNHYVESEDTKAEEVKQLIQIIAEKNNMEDDVAEVLNGNFKMTYSSAITDPKKIEKPFVKINDSLFASSTEVSNEMYELFLTDLLKQKKYDDLQSAKADAVNWDALIPKTGKEISKEELFKNGHPDAPLAPVVNITYESAVMYCKWLTKTYNELEHNRKKYTNVEFRLPTEKEWTYLAKGGFENAIYPWNGNFVRNSKGCFIANLKVEATEPKPDSKKDESEQCDARTLDGALFTVRGDSYFTNKFGLYCMTGNVAEMVNEKGIAKGGSWNSIPKDATIGSKKQYTSKSPEIGFRVIMIVK